MDTVLDTVLDTVKTLLDIMLHMHQLHRSLISAVFPYSAVLLHGGLKNKLFYPLILHYLCRYDEKLVQFMNRQCIHLFDVCIFFEWHIFT